MALFAALILLVGCIAAQAEGFHVRFDETWINAYFLGKKCAWVLDRDGKLLRWAYDDAAPEQVGNLPVVTREMFEDYEKSYHELPAANRQQIDETVTIIAEDESTLYALNQYSGKIGVITQEGLQWTAAFDPQAFSLDSGISPGRFGAHVMNHKLYLLMNCWDEKTNFVLEINLLNGLTREMPVPQGYRMAPYNDQILLVCGGGEGSGALKTLDIVSGQITDLHLEAPASECLAYDPELRAIYVGNNKGIFCSRNGEAFQLISNLPKDFLWGEGAVTQNGQYVFYSGGIWAMTLSSDSTDSNLESNVLRLRLQSSDPKLQSMFASDYPSVQLDWLTDENMTAADIGDFIRSGDQDTDVFSVQVDSAFGHLVNKGYASPMKNEDILHSVERMYPILSDCLLDHQGQVIAYPWEVNIHGMWEVNDALWQKYFGNAAYPVTWKEFFSRMLEFENIENEDTDLFLMYWDYEWMIKQVLTSFIANQDQAGKTVNFTDDILQDTLTLLSQVRKVLLNRGVETYDEAEIFWESEAIGEHSIFSLGQAYSSHSAYMGLKNAMPPFTFAEGDAPIYQGGMRVLIVNPLSQRKELAESFIAMLSQQKYNPMHWYLLHTDAMEPYDQKPYQITTQDIAAWQTTIDAASFSNHSILLSDALDEQINPLVARYAVGQMYLQTMLQKLNDTARMIEYELQ